MSGLQGQLAEISVPGAWQITTGAPDMVIAVLDTGRRHAISGENYLYPMDGTSIKPTEGYLRTVPQPNWQVVGN